MKRREAKRVINEAQAARFADEWQTGLVHDLVVRYLRGHVARGYTVPDDKRSLCTLFWFIVLTVFPHWLYDVVFWRYMRRPIYIALLIILGLVALAMVIGIAVGAFYLVTNLSALWPILLGGLLVIIAVVLFVLICISALYWGAYLVLNIYKKAPWFFRLPLTRTNAKPDTSFYDGMFTGWLKWVTAIPGYTISAPVLLGYMLVRLALVPFELVAAGFLRGVIQLFSGRARTYSVRAIAFVLIGGSYLAVLMALGIVELPQGKVDSVLSFVPLQVIAWPIACIVSVALAIAVDSRVFDDRGMTSIAHLAQDGAHGLAPVASFFALLGAYSKAIYYRMCPIIQLPPDVLQPKPAAS